MKYGFLFSIKRNESQRYGVAARPRAAPPGIFVRLARQYWRVIKGFP